MDIFPVTRIHKGENLWEINNHHYFLFSANSSESIALPPHLLTIAAYQCHRWSVLYYVHCNVHCTCYSLFCMAKFLWGENYSLQRNSENSHFTFTISYALCDLTFYIHQRSYPENLPKKIPLVFVTWAETDNHLVPVNKIQHLGTWHSNRLYANCKIEEIIGGELKRSSLYSKY